MPISETKDLFFKVHKGDVLQKVQFKLMNFKLADHEEKHLAQPQLFTQILLVNGLPVLIKWFALSICKQ